MPFLVRRYRGSDGQDSEGDVSEDFEFQGTDSRQSASPDVFADEIIEDGGGESSAGDDTETIIGGDDAPQLDPNSPWVVTAEGEALRREMMLREVERIQRTNFAHFMLLCLVPTSLLLIVLASVIGDNEPCVGAPASCANEPRAFINAFTTRCICDAIQADP